MTAPYVCENCRFSLAKRVHFIPYPFRNGQPAGFVSQYRRRRNPIHTSSRLSAAQPEPRRHSKDDLETAHAGSSSTSSPPQFPRSAHAELRKRAATTKQFNPIMSIAQQLRKRAGATTETYVAYGACENLVKECARQADYKTTRAEKKNVDIPKTKDGEDLGQGDGWWYTNLGLSPTFNTWAQVTFLHMYTLTCRLRMFDPKLAPIWHQHLLNQFFFKAEERMIEQHGIVAGSVRSKYLKDLFLQWRGLTAGYDEGLVKGDAVLATAIWRNIFKAREDVDFRQVAQVVSYTRNILRGLEGIQDDDVESAAIAFNPPDSGKGAVSTGMSKAVAEVKMKEEPAHPA